MTKSIQFKPDPQVYKWLSDQAKKGYRSVPSIVQEIIAEKMQPSKNSSTNHNKDERTLTGGAK